MEEIPRTSMVIVKNMTNNGLRVGMRERDDTPPDEIIFYNNEITENELHDMCIKLSQELQIQMFDNNIDWVV